VTTSRRTFLGWLGALLAGPKALLAGDGQHQKSTRPPARPEPLDPARQSSIPVVTSGYAHVETGLPTPSWPLLNKGVVTVSGVGQSASYDEAFWVDMRSQMLGAWAPPR
jgi:hypothetical protein